MNNTKWVDNIIYGIGAMAVIFLAAVLSGTLLWMIYPHIHALFPNAASNGIIPNQLSWWDSVCIVWIFRTILPSGSSSSKDKK